jgi:hypothetical protein
MLTTQDSRNETRSPARFVATILFMLMLGMGYAVSPQVEGAVDLQNAVEDQDTADAPSGYVSGGLAFSDDLLDF